jgi:P27 family predicted phage terminase small subunit
MPGPLPKPASRRQNRVTKSLGVVRTAGKAPRMPRGLCKAAQDAWTGYWADTVSGVTRESDTSLLVRWVRNIDRYSRLIAAADRSPMVAGSTGQQRANPIYDLALKIEQSVKQDERQLGIGPMNRLRLGIAFNESAKSLAELNAEAEDDDADDDPRMVLIEDAGNRAD